MAVRHRPGPPGRGAPTTPAYARCSTWPSSASSPPAIAVVLLPGRPQRLRCSTSPTRRGRNHRRRQPRHRGHTRGAARLYAVQVGAPEQRPGGRRAAPPLTTALPLPTTRCHPDNAVLCRPRVDWAAREVAAHHGPWGRLVPVKGVRHGAPVMARGRRTRSHSAAASGAGGFGARPTADTNRGAGQGHSLRHRLCRRRPGSRAQRCHAPEVGFTGPDSGINAAGSVYPGRVSTRFGNRKPPTSAYGGDSPVLYTTTVRASGSAACSGTAAPPGGRSATRSPSRPRGRS